MITKMLKKPMQSAYLVKMYFPAIQRSIVHPTIVMAKHVPFSLFLNLSGTRRVISMAFKDHNDFQDLEI